MFDGIFDIANRRFEYWCEQVSCILSLGFLFYMKISPDSPVPLQQGKRL